MARDQLKLFEEPALKDSCLILGFSGWMDGGEVSTGTVQHLVSEYGAALLGEIDPSDFYIYNVPGPMEIAALFRPGARIVDGLVEEYEMPINRFYYSTEHNVILFEGREPNLKWRDYADCVFSVAEQFDVSMMAFVGSVAGPVPHTRNPVFYSTATDEALRDSVRADGLNATNYEGPSSFATYLLTVARERQVPMVTVVAGIPPYIQGRNHKAIEACIRKLCAILGIRASFEVLEALSRDYIAGINKIARRQPDLASQIRKLEQAYDAQVQDGEQTELRSWFESQDIQLD